ncbi:uncharacterized protein PGTG_11790 [Puccinia graminis f. sp. tritici CRL 75-36-700-3]|uniref:Uncharacterized protein n=1 Tax=Puccinia graminis f. sp. tritici (strain CRL 75-36-700-3 / race SCCL) TaxID=418459 RepID=E3KMA9_PUCGT|nr:uncharacterized protein PGTG_11790 [Puccinia graminis f. sp. tritici CRL 75-36-700-3]EFP85434.1 hypothetical protein PGTG_11790 [Puccinia graminis f. sp. tritici CRL 75-36-700-3]
MTKEYAMRYANNEKEKVYINSSLLQIGLFPSNHRIPVWKSKPEILKNLSTAGREHLGPYQILSTTWSHWSTPEPSPEPPHLNKTQNQPKLPTTPPKPPQRCLPAPQPLKLRTLSTQSPSKPLKASPQPIKRIPQPLKRIPQTLKRNLKPIKTSPQPIREPQPLQTASSEDPQAHQEEP